MTKSVYAVAAAIVAVSLVPSARADTPMVVARKSVEQHSAVLPANTEVLVAMNETITTKGKRFSEGATFEMSVVQDVMLDDYVVIPKGSRQSVGSAGSKIRVLSVNPEKWKSLSNMFR